MIEGSCHCGAVHWTFNGLPDAVTACNCTLCRRYGVFWAYDFEGERITASGVTKAYVRGEKSLGFHFCPECGCLAYWRAVALKEDRRRRMAVNLRLAEPDAVGAIAVNHLDGLVSWERRRDGRLVGDMWF